MADVNNQRQTKTIRSLASRFQGQGKSVTVLLLDEGKSVCHHL